MKKLGRPKLKKEDKKIAIKITVSKENYEAALASGNRSNWFNEAGDLKRKKQSK